MNLQQLLNQNPLTAAQVERSYEAGRIYAQTGCLRWVAIQTAQNLPARRYHPSAFLFGFDSART